MVPDPLYLMVVVGLGVMVALYVRPITLANAGKAIALGFVVSVIGIGTAILGGDDPIRVLSLRSPLGFGRLFVAGLGLVLGGISLLGIVAIRSKRKSEGDK